MTYFEAIPTEPLPEDPSPGLPFDRVLKRDLTVLIAAYLHASPDLRALVLQQAAGDPLEHSLLDCRISVATDAGETDLLLVVRRDGDGCRLALMLEIKIDAIFQPSQALRYRQRGQQGIADGLWDAFRTCVVAPAAYLAGIAEQDAWDAHMKIEEVAAWVRHSGDPHGTFLARVCADVVAKQGSGRNEPSPEATAFWRAYEATAAKLFQS